MIRIAGWALSWWDYVEGRMIRDRIEPSADIPLRTLIALWHSYLLDLSIAEAHAMYAGAGLHAGEDGIPNLTETAARDLAAALAEPLVIDRETWGTDTQAEERLRAMMELVGGPAPLRADPPAQATAETNSG